MKVSLFLLLTCLGVYAVANDICEGGDVVEEHASGATDLSKMVDNVVNHNDTNWRRVSIVLCNEYLSCYEEGKPVGSCFDRLSKKITFVDKMDKINELESAELSLHDKSMIDWLSKNLKNIQCKFVGDASRRDSLIRVNPTLIKYALQREDTLFVRKILIDHSGCQNDLITRKDFVDVDGDGKPEKEESIIDFIDSLLLNKSYSSNKGIIDELQLLKTRLNGCLSRT